MLKATGPLMQCLITRTMDFNDEKYYLCTYR